MREPLTHMLSFWIVTALAEAVTKIDKTVVGADSGLRVYKGNNHLPYAVENTLETKKIKKLRKRGDAPFSRAPG
jgi:hypothetical protein